MNTLHRLIQTRTFWSALLTALLAIVQIWGIDDKFVQTFNIVSGLLTTWFLRDAVNKPSENEEQQP